MDLFLNHVGTHVWIHSSRHFTIIIHVSSYCCAFFFLFILRLFRIGSRARLRTYSLRAVSQRLLLLCVFAVFLMQFSRQSVLIRFSTSRFIRELSRASSIYLLLCEAGRTRRAAFREDAETLSPMYHYVSVGRGVEKKRALWPAGESHN